MWTQIKSACAPPRTPQTTLENTPHCTILRRGTPTEEPPLDEDVIWLGLRFGSALSGHHSIEERLFFPMLAARMPEFAEGGSLTAQHEGIHEGLTRMERYLRRCDRGEEQFQRGVLWGIMVGGSDGAARGNGKGGFEDVLWAHLDEEVWVLRGENMARIWTLDEMRQFRR
ncbi:hypothetical protein BJX64DRAFT_288618 [Aspergillus heterothallicus]